jgi:LysR family glycine cleavage system transcriptional activator
MDTIRMPPLNALRAFEAAARHLSFSRAADELNVTPAALSHQIKGLEAFLELKLFHRRTRQIDLTDAGRLILPDISDGFANLRRAVQLLNQRRDHNVIVVTAGPAFTAKWLAPRLYRFAAAHPDVDLRIAANLALANFTDDGIDAAIRFGSGNFPGLYTEMLFEDVMLPMCSPALLEGPDGIRTPSDLVRHTLIHDESLIHIAPDAPNWRGWLKTAGISGIDADRGLRFNLADHAIDAAIEGAGVVLARKILAQRDLDAGRLVEPFGLELCVKRAFYFVCPAGHEKRRIVEIFREWLADEVARG